MSIQDKQHQLNNNPLLISKFSENDSILLTQKCRGKTIFMGVGLVNDQSLSQTLPFDILGMILSAQLLKKVLGAKQVIVLVADSHALTNELVSPALIKEKAKQVETLLKKVIQNLGLTEFIVKNASDFRKKPEFGKIFDSLKLNNQYLKNEVADLIWLQKTQNVQLKVGWRMDKTDQVKGHDERFFDKEIKKHCPDMSFIHLKPGHTFDESKPRTSPYLSMPGEQRVLLQSGEDVAKKFELAQKQWSDQSLGGAKRHLAHIVRLHHQLIAPLPFMSLAAKIQLILDKATK